MNYYSFFIISIILILYYILYYQNCKIFNNTKYCINKESDTSKFDTLIRLKKELNLLIKFLNDEHKDSEVTKNINKNYQENVIITELNNNNAIAYTKNKGEELSFCLLDQDKKFNTLIFIAIHELSHVATNEVGHTLKFWENFKFLLKCAVKIKIYEPINYSEYPVSYCNLKITHNPLF